MSLTESGGIAGRVGRWSARHKKTAILGWLALIALAVVLGGQVVKQEPTDAQNFSGESRQAEEIRADAGFRDTDRPTETLLVSSKNHTSGDPTFRSAVADLVAAAKRQSAVSLITSQPYGKNGMVSKDGHAALIEVELKGKSEDAANRVAPLMAA